jgi:hypothetical protein
VRFLIATMSVVLAIAIPAVASAGTAAMRLERGVVQSISASQIELRALDGSVVALTIGPRTRIRLNGSPAGIARIRPGFVAEVLHRGARPAVVVRAFGTVPVVVDRGIVTALTPTSITVQTDEAVVTVPLSRTTRFLRRGRPVTSLAAGPGARVAVRYPEGEPARLVRVLRMP